MVSIALSHPGSSKIAPFLANAEHYNYFRDYDPALGRYIESDPIGLRGGLNTYGYVEGAPLGKSDPWGLQAIPVPPRPAPGTGSGSSSGSSDIARGISNLIKNCMPKRPCTLFKAEFKKDVNDFEIFASSPTVRFGGRAWCHYRCPSGDTKVISYYMGPSQIFNDAGAWGFCPKTEEE